MEKNEGKLFPEYANTLTAKLEHPVCALICSFQLAAQTTGSNWLNFFQGTHGFQGSNVGLKVLGTFEMPQTMPGKIMI